MAWWALELVGLPRAAMDSVSSSLFQLGCQGVQEDFLPGQAPPPRQPWDTGPPPPPPNKVVLTAWFEDPSKERVEAAVRKHGGVPDPRWSLVDEVDWANDWKRHFKPVQIGSLVIAPPWDAPEGALIIEPGTGFGTGDHPTTQGAIRAFLALDTSRMRRCLDVGCGSGILALAAARAGLEAEGIDVEAPAIEDAKRNAAANGLEADFSTTDVSQIEAPADVVFGNLHAELIVRLSQDLIRLTGQVLILAGIIDAREHKVRAAIDPYLQLSERVVDGEWVVLVYRR